MKKFKKLLKKSIFLVFFAFFVPFFSIFMINEYILDDGVFSKATSLCGVDVSGLSIEEAQGKLREREENIPVRITLKYKDKIWEYNEQDIEVKSNIHLVLDEMEKYKSLKKIHRNKLINKIKSMGFDSNVAVRFSLANIDEKIAQIEQEINLSPQNATAVFSDKTGDFQIQAEKTGLKLNREKLYDDIAKISDDENSRQIEIGMIEVVPTFKTEDIKKALKKQSEFSTSYSSSSSERKNNIKLSSKALNGVEVLPNEEFSFNEVIGSRTKDKGYKEANIIKAGEFIKGVGGGVCQVSTTLFNALLLSGIEVSEVHKHSLPVSYVGPALDAMVSYGSADLKFVNNTNLPIYILSQASGDKITIKIFGNTKDDNVTIKTRSEIVKTIDAGKDKIIKDTEGIYSDKIMFKGEYLKVKPAKKGYEASSFVDIYTDGKLSCTRPIRHAIYEPQSAIVYEGTEDLMEGMRLPQE